jgi:hypothetical protein
MAGDRRGCHWVLHRSADWRLQTRISVGPERRAPALWRRGEVQLNRLAAGARARLDGELSGTGLEESGPIFSAQLMQTPARSIPQPVQLQLKL